MEPQTFFHGAADFFHGAADFFHGAAGACHRTRAGAVHRESRSASRVDAQLPAVPEVEGDAQEAQLPIAPPTSAAPDASASVEAQVATAGTAEDASVFVFWKPFYSRSAARGFAANLQARSEVDVDVIEEPRIGGRQYRVALPFRSEAERLERIAQLEAATRLRIE